MKYVVVLGDGMADWPIAELGGKTPLFSAETPTLDALAPKSEIGMVNTIPEGMAPGSDTANLSVLGYDPHPTRHAIVLTGRMPVTVHLTEPLRKGRINEGSPVLE